MALEEAFQEERELDAGIDESIRATLKDIESRAAPADDDTVTPVVEAPKDTRVRDETGKFVEKPKESAAPEKADTPAPAAATASDQAAADDTEKPLVTTKGQPIDINRPPSSWKPAAKAAWAALPEPVRAEVHRREADAHHSYAGVKENADFGQTVRQTIEPYRMLIEAEGGTPERAIADTMRTAALFRVGTPDQKLAALFDIDKRYGAGLHAYVQKEFDRLYAEKTGQAAPQQGVQQPQYQDPRVDQLLQNMQRQERERAAQAEAASNAAVETFVNAKDAKGQPLYPFVDNVLTDMSARVEVLRRQNPAIEQMQALKQAYEAAVWANPETREVLLGQQQATANQSVETLRKVEQAKRASAVNVPKRGALPATEPPMSLDDTIRETGKALGMF